MEDGLLDNNMKVLIIQENGHHNKNKNFRECFCLKRGFEHYGINVDIWGKLHDNYHIIPDWNSYDLIFVIEKWDWIPNLSDVQTKKYLWCIDAHCSGLDDYERFADKNDFSKVFHSTLDFTTKEYWLPNCYDDTIIKPMNIDKVYDIGFCGNTVNRQQFINLLASRFGNNFRHDRMVIGNDMVYVINSYKVHWNKNISIDINYRNFETMGCRTCLLTSNNPNYSSLGFTSKNCMIYNNINEMIDMAKYLISNNEIRESIAIEGYNFVKKNHTYKNRAKHIIETLL